MDGPVRSQIDPLPRIEVNEKRNETKCNKTKHKFNADQNNKVTNNRQADGQIEDACYYHIMLEKGHLVYIFN